MLISVHLPKTAGSSFHQVLSDHFGGGLHRDYADFPLHAPSWKRCSSALWNALKTGVHRTPSGIHCIHGHFLPVKYRWLHDPDEPVKFVTWLRHPVERLISHYYFWQDHPELAMDAPLHQQVLTERWSLEKFCQAPALRNTYSRFLWGFPLQRFDFIGITEHFDSDLQDFSRRFLCQPIVTPPKMNAGRSDSNRETLSSSIRRRVEHFHHRDMLLYRWACQRRKARITSI